MKPCHLLIFLISLSTAGFANLLAGAAGGGGSGASYTPQCPQPITVPATVGCVGGACEVTTYPAAHVAGCP
jgi:hypothetical protein